MFKMLLRIITFQENWSSDGEKTFVKKTKKIGGSDINTEISMHIS